ncbi:hypothetical protein SARC_02908 [Sphaeroforma arctica JP610]|uniref:VWFA domain-containing protein n=1 Tax=Sphaeroforma arctica JP610 TaxID=667725 RepID=A0A0L0G7B5_9EUKA|nr:hypothetical protein SARC_02908 [Sphaeroforma arctica JP610]KNC84900.1 hypothetical protein SARC_02908 [Sphaeroforma arctica JP610]|eukprot:XP_014158802.1 hypothetical protein SARC_02908 [Sphaeroforma arctica JP610]
MVLSFGAPLGHRVNQLTKASCSLLRICYALVDNNFGACLPTRRLLSSSRVLISEHRERTAQIRIGQVEIDRYKPKHPENVPANYTHQIPSQSDLRVLRWIIQKDKLAQDMFLVGPPGPEARRLGLWYAEMTGREVEVVALSKDTTESDLKQRREIKNESVLYVDQAPVRAAMKGSLLILDGIEKAERNVLPTLNNLLENREMALSDGRFLCNPDRYDKLVAEGQTVAQLDREQLVRVHPDFRVLAIGLPVPSFPGYPLDPPLRSRFQAAEVTAPTVADVLRQARPSSDYSVTHTPPIHTHTQAHSQAYTEEAAIHRERITTKGVRELIALSTSLRMAHNNSLVRTSTARPLYLSHESVMSGARVLNALAYTPLRDVIGRVYPYWAMTAEQSAAVTGALDRMLPKGDITPRYNLVGGAELLPTLDQSSQTCQAVVSMSLSTDAKGVEDTVSLVVPVGPNLKSMETPALAVPNVGDSFPNFGDTFIATPAHVQVLSDMVVDHSLGRDLCLVGGKGEGKSVLARAFGAYLGYQTETIQLFKDMTARDLLQRRSTCAVTGDTTWHDSPIVTAALSGQLAVLDGLHRLPFDTLVVLHRLIYDRELQLFDGVRLVSQNRYRTLKERCHGNQASLAQLENIVRVIHPSFRIVALANPDTGSSSKKWLQSETLPLFSFHRVWSRILDRPWALHSLNGEGYTESAYLDLGFIPTTVDAELSRVPVNTQTVSEDLDGRVSSSSVLVSVLPSSQLFKVTPLTGDCVGYTLPDVFRGPPVRMQLLYARPKQTDLKLASPTTGSNFGVYEIGKPDFLVLDLETERWSHFFVEDLEGNPEAVASVKSLSANMLSITTTGGGIVMLDTETKEMRTLAQPLGEWEDSVVATELAAPHETYGAWLEPIQGRLHSSVTSGDSSSASPRTFVTHKHDISSADLPPAWDGATFLALHTHGMPQSNMQGTVSALIGSPDKVSVVDLASNHLRYLNIATNGNEQNLTEGKDTQEDPLAGLSPLPWLHQQMGQVVTVQRSGYVRMWEVDEDVLKDGLDTWMTMMGVQHNQPLTLSITEEEPEHNIHGKESSVSNPKNRSKMGAMPGAGRTGGGGDEAQKGGGGGGGGEGGASGTGAGGGEGADKKSDGFGGYQRDDSGQIQLDETHDAAEVQEMALKALDPEVRKQLTKMKKTKNIHGRYQNILEVVQRPIKQLRVVLESVRAKEKEREWINNQNQGDLDDAKLLDGLLGEENIYKRRGEPDQQMGLHQAKPKRMAFVVDLSASMSRFNDWDKRLDRLADAMVMVMESLAGSEHKYHYSIVGHSGSTPTIPLVAYGKPPANENERMDVVSKMYGYAGGSVSGDNTLNAARIAVEEVTAEEADDYYVFVVSDANVGRYDITPTTFGAILSKDERVNAYAIFIAERGAADYLINGLPFGHGFVCEETETLPTVFKDIFTRATMDD